MNLHTFLTAGNATFTVTSRKTGARFTYKVRKTEFDPSRYFVSVLTGPDNEGDFTYAGMLISSKGQLYPRQSKGSKVSATAPSWLGFVWLVSRLNAYSGNGEDIIARQAEVHHEGRCGRCGRKLTVPESIESGFGPECITKV